MKLLGLTTSVLPCRPRALLVARAHVARKRLVVSAQAANTKPSAESEVDDNIVAYCSLDEHAQRPMKELGIKEKEELFLNAMLAYYYDQKPILSNEEFDNLKEELYWEGSKVAVLSSEEKRFLEAKLAFYTPGHAPIMTDAEYDALKARLSASSIFVVDDAPACSLGNAPGKRGQKAGDAATDYAKMAALYGVPAGVFLLILVGMDVLAGIKTPLAWDAIFSLGVGYAGVSFLFKDAMVLKASCPNCGETNRTYFGDILSVSGSRETNKVKCPCCESELTFDAKKRQVVVSSSPSFQ
ncbi:hypothetical protein N2152v2_007869 [Parachlorella kessleri]